MKKGVITDCFKRPLRESFKLAAELGFSGVQIYATTGEFCPDMTAAEKDEIKALLKQYDLEVSALCGDMGGHGFQIAADNPLRIEKTKRIIDLAVEFDTSVVTSHIGVIPEDDTSDRYNAMLSALTECGAYAKGKGVTVAIETGPETAEVLKGFLDKTKGGVGVNLDPANLVMVTGDDPVKAVGLLGKYIVHTHAKDGVMLKRTDPEIIYEHFATGGIEALNIADFFLETPLGEGDVDFKAYIEALRSVDFDGYLTVERETGDDPMADIITALNVLNNFT